MNGTVKVDIESLQSFVEILVAIKEAAKWWKREKLAAASNKADRNISPPGGIRANMITL